jgi:hypothetical protein
MLQLSDHLFQAGRLCAVLLQEELVPLRVVRMHQRVCADPHVELVEDEVDALVV